MQLPESSALLDRVLAMSSEMAVRSDETEKNRAVPPDIMEKLRKAGLFRMMIPQSLGGLELNLLQSVRVIEALARADGSVGWNAMVIFGFNVAIGRFPKGAFDQVLAKDSDVVIRGALAPLGKLQAVAGGYRVSGRWPFASGSYEPEWIVASGRVFENGNARTLATGEPEMKMALVPGDRARFLDTWDTVGLRGTSSHDFTIEDEFVPQEFTTNLFDVTAPSLFETPLLRLPFRTLAGPTHSAVVIGIAQGALDDIVELSQTKRGAFTPGLLLAEDPIFRHRLGHLSARLTTLRDALDRMVQKIQERAESSAEATASDAAAASALVTHTHAECISIVDEVFTLGSGTTVYNSCPIQRRWRDVRCAAQHVGASQANYGRHGELLVTAARQPDSRLALSA